MFIERVQAHGGRVGQRYPTVLAPVRVDVLSDVLTKQALGRVQPQTVAALEPQLCRQGIQC